jgi:hypothetical protein
LEEQLAHKVKRALARPVVGLPLLSGVVQTFEQVMSLFRTA